MKTCRYSKGLYGITLGSTAETHRQSTAAQAVVHHGRSASGVGEFGGLLKSGAIRSSLYTDGQKSGSNPGGLVPRRKTDIPEIARTSIIRHSSMRMIPSESSICHTNLGTTICFVPWSGY